jgi:hypothetical protein
VQFRCSPSSQSRHGRLPSNRCRSEITTSWIEASSGDGVLRNAEFISQICSRYSPEQPIRSLFVVHETLAVVVNYSIDKSAEVNYFIHHRGAKNMAGRSSAKKTRPASHAERPEGRPLAKATPAARPGSRGLEIAMRAPRTSAGSAPTLRARKEART